MDDLVFCASQDSVISQMVNVDRNIQSPLLQGIVELLAIADLVKSRSLDEGTRGVRPFSVRLLDRALVAFRDGRRNLLSFLSLRKTLIVHSGGVPGPSQLDEGTRSVRPFTVRPLDRALVVRLLDGRRKLLSFLSLSLKF